MAKILKFQLQHQYFRLNIQDWFSLEWTGLISLQSKGLSSVFSNTSLKASILRRSAFFIVQLSHPYMTTGKTIALTRWTFVHKVMSLLFNMLSRLVIAFLPRSKHTSLECLSVSCGGSGQRDDTGREVGGGYRMGNKCTRVAGSCWCMAKPIPYVK